jgi:hypothetical protein
MQLIHKTHYCFQNSCGPRMRFGHIGPGMLLTFVKNLKQITGTTILILISKPHNMPPNITVNL